MTDPLATWDYVWLYAFDYDMAGAPTTGSYVFMPKVTRLINYRDVARTPALAQIARGSSVQAEMGKVPPGVPYPTSVPAGGFMACRVRATDDPDNSVVGFTVGVQEPGGRGNYDVVVPYDYPVLDCPSGFGAAGTSPHPLHGVRAINLATVQPAASATGGAVQVVPGPPGPPGPPGGTPYVHSQSAPAASWLIVHNLGRYPQVTVVDLAGARVLADLAYGGANTVTVIHAAPTAGVAYLL